MDNGRPVKGLRLEIGERPAITDANGVAMFSHMQPGLFSVSVGRDAGIPDGVDLEVKLDGPLDVTVPLKWPSGVLRSRSLKGVLHSPDSLPGQSGPRLSLDLIEAVSGGVVRSGQTDSAGEFNFPDTPPGLYFLRLNPSGPKGWSGELITGLIAIAVDPSANADGLDLDLGWTSCGLNYTDRNTCSQSELQAERLCGRVLDPSEATDSKVEILLFEAGEGHRLLERMETDERGRFTSPISRTGTYQLEIRSPGFSSLHEIVHLQPTREPTCGSPINVHLNILGACSVAGTQ
jgi:hypothetical protein